jgi:sec-independent protein translocase protein TatA
MVRFSAAVTVSFVRQNWRIQMFEGLLQPMHLLVIFGIALLVFGPKKLPELGKGLGESIRGFKGAMAQPPEKVQPEKDKNAKAEV